MDSGGQYIDDYGCPVVFKKSTYIHTNLYQEDETMNENDMMVIEEYAAPVETWKEIVYEAYKTGRRHERIATMKKRKRMIENIKFTIVFGTVTIGMPLLMCLHWLVIGY